MRSTIARQFTVGLAAIAAVAAGLGPVALAQTPKSIVSGLQENQDLIGQCRRVNQTVLVFNNTDPRPSTNPIGTLQAGTEVSLTGVVSPGRAQIFFRNDSNSLSPGWINDASLSPCRSRPQSALRSCFRANVPLDVRPTPSFSDNPIRSFEVDEPFAASTNSPQRRTPPRGVEGPSWLEVSLANGTGWVVEVSSSGQVYARTSPCP